MYFFTVLASNMDMNPSLQPLVVTYPITKRISMHQGAALVIARKGLGFKKRVSSQIAVTLPLSVRDRCDM